MTDEVLIEMNHVQDVLYMLADMCERTDISKEDRLEFSKAREVLRTAIREGRDDQDALKDVCRSLIETCDRWIKAECH
jgi:hypothetical protein